MQNSEAISVNNSVAGSRSLMRDRRLIGASIFDKENVGFADDDSETRKKRKKLREDAKKLASRQPGVLYDHEMPLMPISPYNPRCDPDLYFKMPSLKSSVIENRNTTPRRRPISPIEDLNILHDNSKQVRRFATANEHDTDSKRSFKLRESFESQKASSQVVEAKSRAMQVEEVKEPSPVKGKKAAKKPKALSKGRKTRKQSKPVVEEIIKESEDKYAAKIKAEEDEKKNKSVFEAPFEYNDNNDYNDHNDYDNYNEHEIASLLAIKKESMSKFNPSPPQQAKIIEKPKPVEKEVSSRKIVPEENSDGKQTVKRTSVPFTDKTNQSNKRSKSRKPPAKNQETSLNNCKLISSRSSV